MEHNEIFVQFGPNIVTDKRSQERPDLSLEGDNSQLDNENMVLGCSESQQSLQTSNLRKARKNLKMVANQREGVGVVRIYN